MKTKPLVKINISRINQRKAITVIPDSKNVIFTLNDLEKQLLNENYDSFNKDYVIFSIKC
jgi:translation initiation factor 1 (eIF-1/SUI1)